MGKVVQQCEVFTFKGEARGCLIEYHTSRQEQQQCSNIVWAGVMCVEYITCFSTLLNAPCSDYVMPPWSRPWTWFILSPGFAIYLVGKLVNRDSLTESFLEAVVLPAIKYQEPWIAEWPPPRLSKLAFLKRSVVFLICAAIIGPLIDNWARFSAPEAHGVPRGR